MLTLRRTWSEHERESRHKRGKGLFTRHAQNLDALPDREPPPDLATSLADFLEEALARLPEPEQRAVALFKLQGDTNEEIGSRLGCDPRTVQRRWKAARDLWRSWAES